MNKLEVGMYVRTEHYGIRKICNFVSSLLDDFIEDENKLSINKIYIVKSSYNIIDLIEVGDYVNGKEISGIDEYTKKLTYEYGETTMYIDSENIRTIVTKEQFKSIEYKIGDSNE